MVTVFDMASGEVLSCAEAEPVMDSRQQAESPELAPRLQPVSAETCHETKRVHPPLDIAGIPVAWFLAKQTS